MTDVVTSNPARDIEPTTHGSKTNSIDMLRGIAVILVFVHHLHSIIGVTIPYFAYVGGWLGVQIFFVISGYLIILSAKRYSFLNYTKHRLLRIYPAYLFWFLVFLLIQGKLNFSDIKVKDLILHLTFLQHLSPNAYMRYDSLNVSWTLTIEMIWYVAAIILATRFHNSLEKVTFSAVIIACLWGYGGVHLYPSYSSLSDPEKVFFAHNNAVAQMPYFLFGALIATRKPTFDTAGLVAIVISTIALFPVWQMAFPNPIFLTGLGTSAIFLILKQSSYKPPGPIKLLSDISYSFYLTHYPIIVLLSKTIENKTHVAIAAFVATTVVSYASYKLIEQPFIRLGNRKHNGQPDHNAVKLGHKHATQ